MESFPTIMKNLEYKEFYRRKLPHYQPIEAELFITFRLAGSLPEEVIAKLQQEKQQMEKELEKIDDLQLRKEMQYEQGKILFAQYDKYLNNTTCGPKWLNDKRIASLVLESIKYRDGKVYHLYDFCVMPNHVHVVFKPILGQDGILPYSMTKIMHSLKRYTAREANKILKREGQFWQHESYDHVVINEKELQRIINYVLNNPVKAGLVESWEDWEWSYCKFY